jgi:flagellin
MSSMINTNISSLTAQRNLSSSQASLSTSMQRLSSGLRINSAKDDAAGLAISERMTSQIRGASQAARNANDGISLAQTAEGDLAQIGSNLQRMRELAVQSANATNSASEIDRAAKNSSFNGNNLLDGSFVSKDFQVGANGSAADKITVSSIASVRTSAMGSYQGFNLSNQSIGTASDSALAQTVTVAGGAAVSLGTIANDAKSLASAINSSGVAGLGATANATSVGTAVQAASAAVGTITVNGLAINVTATANAGTNRTNAVTALNAQSSVTGVIATDTGSGVSLAAADGRNITTVFGSVTETQFGMAAAGTTGASLNVTYQAPAGITGTVAFGGAFAPAASTIASTGTAISAIDVLSASSAITALASIDSAIGAVNTSRASLGALQNRFTSVVTSLQTTSENLSASRSRIQDADFAQETANLSRSQILQQAGTAMVAQANQLPQGVLALLR